LPKGSLNLTGKRGSHNLLSLSSFFIHMGITQTTLFEATSNGKNLTAGF